MLYIEDSALVKSASREDVVSNQGEVNDANRTSWMDLTLAEAFSNLNLNLQAIFGFFVKMLVLVTLIYFVYSLVTVLPLAVAELIQIFSKDTP